MRVLRSASSASDAVSIVSKDGSGAGGASHGGGGALLSARGSLERVKAEKISQHAALHAWNDNDAVNRWLDESYRNRSLGAHVQV
jgi:hypothetical protein